MKYLRYGAFIYLNRSPCHLRFKLFNEMVCLYSEGKSVIVYLVPGIFIYVT